MIYIYLVFTTTTAILCIIALITAVYAIAYIIRGFRSIDVIRKYECYRIAVKLMIFSLFFLLKAIFIFSIGLKFDSLITEQPFWKFGWAYITSNWSFFLLRIYQKCKSFNFRLGGCNNSYLLHNSFPVRPESSRQKSWNSQWKCDGTISRLDFLGISR